MQEIASLGPIRVGVAQGGVANISNTYFARLHLLRVLCFFEYIVIDSLGIRFKLVSRGSLHLWSLTRAIVCLFEQLFFSSVCQYFNHRLNSESLRDLNYTILWAYARGRVLIIAN